MEQLKQQVPHIPSPTSTSGFSVLVERVTVILVKLKKKKHLNEKPATGNETFTSLGTASEDNSLICDSHANECKYFRSG